MNFRGRSKHPQFLPLQIQQYIIKYIKQYKYMIYTLYVQSLAVFEKECDSFRAAQVYASGSLGFSLSSVSEKPHDLREIT